MSGKSTITPLDLRDYEPPDEARKRHKNNSTKMRKLEALELAGFKCVACGSRRRLTIHHLTKKVGVRDLRTVLCIPCHDEVHGR